MGSIFRNQEESLNPRNLGVPILVKCTGDPTLGWLLCCPSCFTAPAECHSLPSQCFCRGNSRNPLRHFYKEPGCSQGGSTHLVGGSPGHEQKLRGTEWQELGGSGGSRSSNVTCGCPFLPYIPSVAAELSEFRISEN